jgi:hypothetical protein
MRLVSSRRRSLVIGSKEMESQCSGTDNPRRGLGVFRLRRILLAGSRVWGGVGANSVDPTTCGWDGGSSVGNVVSSFPSMSVSQMPLLQLGNGREDTYGYNADGSLSQTAGSCAGGTAVATGPFGEEMEDWGVGGAIGRWFPGAPPWEYEQGEIMYS